MTDQTTARAEYAEAVLDHVRSLRPSRRWAERREAIARKITERGQMYADAAVREANLVNAGSVRRLIGQRDDEEAAKVRAEAKLAVAEAHHEEVLADLGRDLAEARGEATDWARRCAEALQERDDVTEERDRLRSQMAAMTSPRAKVETLPAPVAKAASKPAAARKAAVKPAGENS